MTAAALHPRDLLPASQASARLLPVCDHYSGTEARMRKSLQLQRALMVEYGRCIVDVTLDCEDGAPAGQERAHASLVSHLVQEAAHAAATQNYGSPRIAVRVHPVDHPAFVGDIAIVAGDASRHLCHVMVPKVETVDDVLRAEKALNAAGAAHLPLHVLIESSKAVHHAFEIAAHPRVQSLSFGLLDFVSSHGGAIPESAMTSQGQFEHPLVVRAKLEIAAACHAHGKVPSHCVVAEFNDSAALQAAARRVANEFGYLRMWSIHPEQIRPIVAAFAPKTDEVERAARILCAAEQNDWAPVGDNGTLHDRASYRYFWQVLERAQHTGQALPENVRKWFTKELG